MKEGGYFSAMAEKFPHQVLFYNCRDYYPSYTQHDSDILLSRQSYLRNG